MFIEVAERRTLNIVLGVCFLSLVVVYQLDDVQEVVLTESLQTLGQLLHVDLLLYLSATIVLRTRRATYSLGSLLSLLGLGSTVGIAHWPRFPQSFYEFGLGVAESLCVVSHGLNKGLWVKTYKLLQTLIALLLEVQVVEDSLFALWLGERLKDNGHVEFTPSLLLNPERRVLQICIMYSRQRRSLSGRWA